MTRPLPTIALAVSLALAAALPVVAQSLRYAPGEYKYTVLTVSKQEQTTGDQSTKVTITMDERLSLLLTPRNADSLRFRLILDQVTLSADLPIQLQDVSKLQGTTVEGIMTTGGRMPHFTHRLSPTSGAEVDARAEQMAHFLLVLPREATVGQSWSDTTVNRSSADGNPVDERTVTNTTFVGDTTYAGERAYRLRRETIVTRRGATAQGGKRWEFAAQAIGAGTFYISTRGVFLGARSRQQTTTTFKLPDGPSSTVSGDATSVIALSP